MSKNKKYGNDSYKKSHPRVTGNKGKMEVFKPSPKTGKVSTDRLTEGASVSRNKRTILTCVRRLAPIASQGSALPSVFGGS